MHRTGTKHIVRPVVCHIQVHLYCTTFVIWTYDDVEVLLESVSDEDYLNVHVMLYIILLPSKTLGKSYQHQCLIHYVTPNWNIVWYLWLTMMLMTLKSVQCSICNLRWCWWPWSPSWVRVRRRLRPRPPGSAAWGRWTWGSSGAWTRCSRPGRPAWYQRTGSDNQPPKNKQQQHKQ